MVTSLRKPSRSDVGAMNLELVTKALIAGLAPERIVLFGSRARGTATHRSDLDLFVVQETDKSPLQRIEAGLKLLPPLPCDVDIIVYTPAELEARRDAPFIRRLLREGQVLYER